MPVNTGVNDAGSGELPYEQLPVGERLKRFLDWCEAEAAKRSEASESSWQSGHIEAIRDVRHYVLDSPDDYEPMLEDTREEAEFVGEYGA